MVQAPNPKAEQVQIGFSANSAPLEPEPAHFFTDFSQVNAQQNEPGIDAECYAMCMQNAE